jgi:hypothetical protein
VTDLAATPVICFQPEPWQIEQTVDEEVTEGILKSPRLVVRLYYAGSVRGKLFTHLSQRTRKGGAPGKGRRSHHFRKKRDRMGHAATRSNRKSKGAQIHAAFGS